MLFLQLGTQTVVATVVALLAARWFGATGIALAVIGEVLVCFAVARAFVRLRVDQQLALADSAVTDGEIEQDNDRLIQSVMQFSSTIAREIMVPRPDMVTLPSGTSADEAIDFAITNGYSRIPVRGEDQDEILGLLLTKEMLSVVHNGRGSAPVREFLREPTYIPETKRVAELLREMQLSKTHMVMVVDEYGTTVGLITLEDLIEELVGEISDEHDAVERAAVERIADGHWSIDARMPINDVYGQIDVNLPHGDWDTVGGLLINAFGRVPSLREEIHIGDLHFTVEETSDRRVTRVVLKQVEPAQVGTAQDQEQVP